MALPYQIDDGGDAFDFVRHTDLAVYARQRIFHRHAYGMRAARNDERMVGEFGKRDGLARLARRLGRERCNEKQLVVEQGLSDAVIFLGAIAEEELQKLYEGAAVYVYPAPEEDFGMGVIESMAKGVPVVAWNQAGPTVTVGPGTGHLAEPLEVSDYAAGISDLLDNPAANQLTGERAVEWARRFDWERHVDTLERAVLEVARTHERFAAEAATA